jgi:hypothetical protein
MHAGAAPLQQATHPALTTTSPSAVTRALLSAQGGPGPGSRLSATRAAASSATGAAAVPPPCAQARDVGTSAGA